jgi:hypothetical protein
MSDQACNSTSSLRPSQASAAEHVAGIVGINGHALVVDLISEGKVFIRDPWSFGNAGGTSYSLPLDIFKEAFKGKGVVFEIK